jgi:DNA invertase Pin-like site-specific DNA recombinase
MAWKGVKMQQYGITNHAYSAAIYCRFSKDDGRAEDSSSIHTQKMMLEKYCMEQGYSIYEVYIDDGYSGLNYDRPDFQRLLNDIDSGKVNLVVTKDLSRLGRDYIQTGYYTDIYFQRKKVRYIAVNDNVDTQKADNDIAPFKNILNDMYSRDLSRKVKSAKRQRAYSGYFISSQAPYGYKVNPQNRNQLIVDEEPAEVVKEMFSLALAGQSTVQITKILTERKVMTPSAYKAKNGDTKFDRYNQKEWCNITVQQILRNRVYCGDMENHKYEVLNYKTKERVVVPKDERIVVEDTHEAIVERDVFDRVQALIKQRHKPKRHNYENVLKSLVFCGDCGFRMTFMAKQRKTMISKILVCRNHFLRPEVCTYNHQISYHTLYDIVLENIKVLAKTVDSGKLMDSLRKKLSTQKKTDKLETEKGKILTRLSQLAKITKKLYEDNACGVLDTDSYRAFLSEYQQEQKQLSQRLSEIEAELNKKNEYAENLRQLSEAVGRYTQVESLTTDMVNQLIERIEVGHLKTENGEKRQNIRIVWRFIGDAL